MSGAAGATASAGGAHSASPRGQRPTPGTWRGTIGEISPGRGFRLGQSVPRPAQPASKTARTRGKTGRCINNRLKRQGRGCNARRAWLSGRPSRCAPVAQLDRASDYESEGRTFESFRAHHSFAFFLKGLCHRQNSSRARISHKRIISRFVCRIRAHWLCAGPLARCFECGAGYGREWSCDTTFHAPAPRKREHSVSEGLATGPKTHAAE